MNDRLLEGALRLRRAPVWLGLAVIVASSWLYLFHMSATMPGMTSPMPNMTSTMARAASVDILFAFVMWSVMMVAMMVPTAVPAIALFAALTERRHPLQDPAGKTAIYVSGYIAAWVGYAAFAAVAQWALTRAMVLSPMAGSSSTTVSALILLSAGAFQFTSLKNACLTKCRSPLAFYMAEWRDGSRGAFVLGLRQGAYCVTCCWMLMAVMFVVGVMNLAAMALLTVFLLAEKLAPPAWHISRVSGAVLIAWGIWIGAGI